jgi:hypothetical protein
MGVGEDMVVTTAMQTNSIAGVYLEKELHKKQAKRGTILRGGLPLLSPSDFVTFSSSSLLTHKLLSYL